MEYRGIIPPICTAVVDRDGTIDEDRLRTHASFLIEAGVNGLFVGGTAGEFTSLSSQQRNEAIRVVTETVDEVPVLAGVGSPSLTAVREHIDVAASAGASAAVVITPYYLPASIKGIESFYETIADDSPLPVLLYHIPKLTSQSLPVESVVRLADHENIIGIKDSSGNLARMSALVRQTPSSFMIFEGSTAQSAASLGIGVDGLVPGPGNVVPEAFVELYKMIENQNDWTRANDLMNQTVLPLVNLIGELPGLSALKYAAGLRSTNLGPPVSPLRELDSDEKQRVREFVDLVS